MMHYFKNSRKPCCQKIHAAADTASAALSQLPQKEPFLEPSHTMLFYTPFGKRIHCSFLLKKHYQKRIFSSCRWGLRHGITTFVADYTTPFGLLALETLCKLRETGEKFKLLGLQGYPISQRKTYRLMLEPYRELERLYLQCDEQCCDGAPLYAVRKVYSAAGLHCTENGLIIMRFLLMDNQIEP